MDEHKKVKLLEGNNEIVTYEQYIEALNVLKRYSALFPTLTFKTHIALLRFATYRNKCFSLPYYCIRTFPSFAFSDRLPGKFI